MTQAELDSLIDGLIIDNRERQISPYVLRKVLHAMVGSLNTDSANLSAQIPLVYDPFTGILSVKKYAIPATSFKFVQKGFGNSDLENNEIGDIFCGWKNDGSERWSEAIWNGGALTDSDNFTSLVQTIIT